MIASVDAISFNSDVVWFRLISFDDCCAGTIWNAIRPRFMTQPYGSDRVGLHPLLQLDHVQDGVGLGWGDVDKILE